MTFDVLVVGSGATGVMAAQTLADSGASVLIVDGGVRDDTYRALVPAEPFVALRRSDEQQYRYFLGERFESAAFAGVGAGAQLTPPRRFIVERAAEMLPVRADAFVPVESLAIGGLAAGWGLLCAVYSDAELAQASLPAAAMREAYQAVADRIGISGAAADDAQPHTYGRLAGVQPPVPLDPAAQRLAGGYRARRDALRARGFDLGRPALALLTQLKDGRSATQLRDMDFYDDAGGSAWRPAQTLEPLLRRPNVAYAGGFLATAFREDDDGVVLDGLDMRTKTRATLSGRRLVLACGALGSARITLRSLASGAAATRLPLLCNPYTYAACLVPARLGRAMPERNNSLVQLVFFHDPARDGRDVAMGTIFTYRSLLLFRLLREMPIGVRDALAVMRFLLSGFAIVGMDHPQAYGDGKELWLEPDATSPTGDTLRVAYALTPAERAGCDRREREMLAMLRTIGALPLRRVRPPLGASIHYAGTLPYGAGDTPFALDPFDGRLHGTRNVHVADGSGFTFLPAKGLTLSLMANAHRIARNLAARR